MSNPEKVRKGSLVRIKASAIREQGLGADVAIDRASMVGWVSTVRTLQGFVEVRWLTGSRPSITRLSDVEVISWV